MQGHKADMGRAKLPELILGLVLLVCLSVTGHTTENKLYRFDVPEQAAGAALNAFAQQAEQQVLFPFNRVKGIISNSLKGEYTVAEGIAVLLRGTGLKPVFGIDGVITISSDTGIQAVKERNTLMKKEKRSPLLTRLALMLFGTVNTQGILAQDMSAAGDKNELVIEEIIVSANKREENLQDVAIAIAAISGEKLDESGLNSVIDVAKLVPGIHFQDRQDQRTGAFGIRGINTPQTATGAEPSAAIMLDGESFARSTAFHNDLVDIERVEVLKGPQGTLFGKNTSVGAMHIISRRPGLEENYGELSFTVAEDEEYRIKGAYNAVLGENTAMRINALYKSMGGWLPNVRSGEPDGGDSESYGVRAQFLHELSADTDLLWRMEYSEQDYGPGIRAWIELNSPDDRIHTVSQTPFGPDNNRTSQLGGRDYGDLKNFGTSLEINHRIGDHTLTYQGSYRDFDLYTNEDQSAVAVKLYPEYFAGPTTSKTTQHELRIASPTGGFFDYVAGLYYYYEDTSRNEFIDSCVADPGLNNSTIDPATFEITACPNTLGFGFLNSDLNTGPGNDGYFKAGVNSTIVEKNNYAAFGQANWRLTDQVNLITGIRVLHEEQDFQLSNTINRNIADYTRSVSDTDVLYKAGLQYFINDDVMAYFTYSTGYKGVAWFNTPGFTDPDAANDNYPTAAEESTQYEIGFRSDLLNNRLRLNINLFRLEIEGFQDRVFFVDPTTGVEFRRLINAGDVRSQGVELDAVAVISDQLQVSFAANYLDAEFDSDIFVGCPAAFLDAQLSSDCVAVIPGGAANRLNLNGRPTANSPEWQFNLSGRYDFTLAGGYYAYVRADYRWKDDETSEPSGVRRFIKDSHGIADVYFGISSPNQRYSLGVFVKNVFDEQYYSHHSSSDGFFATIISPDSLSGSVPRDFNRYVGANLTVNF